MNCPNVIHFPEFVNGVEQNNLHPDTFRIPSGEEKAALEVGDYVKLGFRVPAGASKDEDVSWIKVERMWVNITELKPQLKGRLDNTPVVAGYIKDGDIVAFTPAHILDILKPDEFEQ